MGKKSAKVARPEPGAIGNQRPDSATRMKKVRLTMGPAASALGTSVLTPTPSAL